MLLNIDNFIEALELDEEIEEQFSEEFQRELFLEYVNKKGKWHQDVREKLLKAYKRGDTFSGEKGLRRKLAAIDMEYFGRAYLPHYFVRKSPDFHKELNDLWTEEVLKELNPVLKRTAKTLSRSEGNRLAIAAPRGHAKSTNFTFKNPLHSILYKYKNFILILSDSSDQAEGFLSDIKMELEDNPLIREDFGELKGKKNWTESSITTANNVKVEAIGSGKKVRGRRFRNWRPDLIVLDDVENDENVRTPEQRKKLYNWFSKAVEKAGDSYTDICYIGTVLHYDSLLMRTLKNPRYRSVVYRGVISWSIHPQLWDAWEAIYTNLENAKRKDDAKVFFEANKSEMLEGTEVLWEEKNSYYLLMVDKVTGGDAAFNSEIQNEPLDPESRVFNEEWIDYWDDDPNPPDFSHPRFVVVGAVDPSLGKNSKSDDSTIIAILKDLRTGYMYVVVADLEKRHPDIIINDTIESHLRLIRETNKGYRVLGVETVQFQEFFKDAMVKESSKRNVYLPIEGILQKGNKDLRIRRLQPFIKNGYIKFSRRHKRLMEQILNYPMTANDDGPDALEMAVSLAEQITASMDASAYKTVTRRRFARVKGAY